MRRIATIACGLLVSVHLTLGCCFHHVHAVEVDGGWAVVSHHHVCEPGHHHHDEPPSPADCDHDLCLAVTSGNVHQVLSGPLSGPTFVVEPSRTVAAALGHAPGDCLVWPTLARRPERLIFCVLLI